MTSNLENTTGYSSGHPWYYVRGGQILTLKQIFSEVENSGYEGYMREGIYKAADKSEPERSHALRKLKEEVRLSFRDNASIYRECVKELRLFRVENTQSGNKLECKEIHTSISLKRNHLYNDFAHVRLLDKLMSYQLDLFDS